MQKSSPRKQQSASSPFELSGDNLTTPTEFQKLDTLIIPILDESRFLAWKRTPTHDGQPIATETTCSRVNEKDYVYVQWKMDEDAEPLCMLGTVINKTKEGARIHYFNGGEFYNNAGEPFHSDHPAHDTIYKVNMPGQQPAKAQQEQKKQQPAAPQQQ
jgi:hypothetical protein